MAPWEFVLVNHLCIQSDIGKPWKENHGKMVVFHVFEIYLLVMTNVEMEACGSHDPLSSMIFPKKRLNS